MDEKDKAILREAQSRLPIAERPFLELGRTVGLSEDEVIERLAAMKRSGLVRRIGGNFNSASLGFSATLCGAKVAPEKLDAFVAAVNAHHGVTHNYLRSHEFNVWFTFIAEDMAQIDEHLARLAEQTGVDEICSMPALEMFKIKVDFPI